MANEDKSKRLNIIELNDPIPNDQLIAAGEAGGRLFDAFDCWGTGEAVLVWEAPTATRSVCVMALKDPRIIAIVNEAVMEMINRQKGG